MRINVFSLSELNKSAEAFCGKFCPLKEDEYCVLSPESAGGIICPISYFIDKLETGELKK